MFCMRASDIALRMPRAHYGWLVVAVVFLSAGLLIGTSNYAFGLFIEPLEATFNWSRTAISASLSFMAIGSLTSPFLGRLMDRYGARPVMAGSLVTFGVSFALRPLITELWHLYALSFLQFMCFSGAALLPAGRLVGIWFPRTRGRVMGITMVGNNFGGLTMPFITGFVLASATEWGVDVPWKMVFLIIAALSFVLAFAALALVHEEPGGRDDSAVRPDPSRAARQALTGWTLREAIRTRAFYAITLVAMLASFTYSAVLPHVNAHLAAEGLSTTVVIAAVGLLATFGMGGKVVFGYLAERITARRAMIGSLSGQIVFIVLMVSYPSLPLVWVTVPLYGFFMGAYGVLGTLIVQESFGIRYFGSISGLSQMATVVPMVTGPLIAGLSFDLWDDYGPAFLAVAGLFAVSVVTLMRTNPPKFTTEITKPTALEI